MGKRREINDIVTTHVHIHKDRKRESEREAKSDPLLWTPIYIPLSQSAFSIPRVITRTRSIMRPIIDTNSNSVERTRD